MSTNANPIAPLAGVVPQTDIHAIKPPLVIAEPWLWFWLVLAIVIAALVAWYFWKKNRQQVNLVPSVPPVPPHIKARQRLQEALALIGQPQPFCVAVSDTIRTYLEERFDFHAPDRTTEEFLHELKSTQLLMPDQKQSLGDFLSMCDMVKFARYEPGQTELKALHESASRLIDETEPQPQPESTVANSATAP